MTAGTIWAGPVNAQQVGGLTWPGSLAVYVTCTGDGDPSCGQIAAAKPLNQIGRPDTDPIYLAAFSAGGSAVKRWLPDAQVRGVYLADGTYTHWLSPGRPAPDQTLVDFVIKAARDPSFRAVFTASSWPNGTLPNGAQTLEAIAQAAARAGVGWTIHQPDRGIVELAGVQLADARAWTAGGAYLIDLGQSVPHAAHATKIAPLLWGPLFVGQKPSSPIGSAVGGLVSGAATRGLAIAAGVLLGSTVAIGLGAAVQRWRNAPAPPP